MEENKNGPNEIERQVSPKVVADDLLNDKTIRPQKFDDYTGQHQLKENLGVFINAALTRGDTLDHILLCGPPGLGKTTLAYIVANQMGVVIHCTSGPAMERKGDLAGILTNLEEGDILFIDEIHRLNSVIEENLYPAMEDFNFDIVIGEGPGARTIKMPLKPFTLIGATTRTGLLTSPLRNRFGFIARLDFYTCQDLEKIVKRSATILQIEITDQGAIEIARRSRGTPRTANRLLRRVRDFAQEKGDNIIDQDISEFALSKLEVDKIGLDKMDRDILYTIIEKFEGGPVGLETLAVSISESKDTIEEVYEPFLIQNGLIKRTPRGRIACTKAYEHLKITQNKEGSQQTALF